MARIDGIIIPSLVFDGQATPPSTPGSGQFRLFVDDAGLLKWVDEAGNVLEPAGIDATGQAVNKIVQADGSDGIKFGPAFTVGDTEPPSPANDDVWFHTGDGVLYVRVDGAWLAFAGGAGASDAVAYDFTLETAGAAAETFYGRDGSGTHSRADFELVEFDGEISLRVMRTISSGGRVAVGWTELDAIADMEMVVLARYARSVTTHLNVHGGGVRLHDSGADHLPEGSAVRSNATNLVLVAANGFTSLGQQNSNPELSTTDVWGYIRVQVIGGDVKARAWDTSETEPGWQIEEAELPIEDGFPAMVNVNATDSTSDAAYFRWIGLSSNPSETPAPLPGELTPVNG